jgi:hypothetical protein
MAKKLKFVGSKPAAAPAPAAPVKGKTKAAPAAAAAPAKKTREPKESKPRRFAGVTSGLGVLQYQNKTLFDNVKRKLTDTALAADWRREFPNAIAEYTEETVSGVRNLVNRGKHGNPDQVPNPPLHAWDENGKPVANWGDKTKAKAAAKAEAEPPPAPAKKVKKTKTA